MHFFALFHTASPIQPPPLRGTSFHRKEGVSTRAPSLGRGCQAQRGGVGFLFGRRSRLLFAFPIGKGVVLRKAVDRMLSQTAYLRRSSPIFFIPLEPYPARSARHLPHAGKALFQGYRFPHPTSAPSGHLLPQEGGSVHASPFPWKGLPSAARRGCLPFWAVKPPPLCLPHWGWRCRGNGILVSSSIPRKHDRLLRAVVFMCITCLGKR